MDVHWSTSHPPNSIAAAGGVVVVDERAASSTNYEFGIPNLMATHHPDLRQFSIYDEAYNGFAKFRMLMRWAGLFPVVDAYDESWTTTTNSTVDGMTYSFRSLWSIYSVFVPGLAVFVLFYVGIWHYALQLSDATEAAVFGCFLAFFCVTAAVNWFNCIAAAPHWKHVFRRFQLIDTLLDIEWDVELRSHGTNLFKLFVAILSALAAGLAILTVKQALAAERTHKDDANYAAAVSFFTFSIGCHLFPEALFSYLCRAVNIRLARSARLLERNLEEKNPDDDHDDDDVVGGIENVRIAHQLILDTVRDLNHIVGPILVAFCIFNTYGLCLCVYFFLLRSISILSVSPWRELLLIVSSIRIAPLCLMANKVQEKILSTALHQIESSKYSKKCKTEILFLLANVETTIPSVTAWEFWDVDQGFLTTVSGILLTYAITALQFAQVNKAADTTPGQENNSTNNNYTNNLITWNRTTFLMDYNN